MTDTVSLRQWERDEQGQLLRCRLVLKCDDNDEAYWQANDHPLKNLATVPSDWLPFHFQHWMAENLEGKWWFDIKYDYNPDRMQIGRFWSNLDKSVELTFEKIVDAVITKLRWA